MRTRFRKLKALVSCKLGNKRKAVENYQPISVFPMLSEFMEGVVQKQINASLDRLGFLYK